MIQSIFIKSKDKFYKFSLLSEVPFIRPYINKLQIR